MDTNFLLLNKFHYKDILKINIYMNKENNTNRYSGLLSLTRLMCNIFNFFNSISERTTSSTLL